LTCFLEIEEEKAEIPSINNQRKFEIGEHIDCLDTVNHWLNAEIIHVSALN